MGRPLAPLTLTPDERATLELWARRPASREALALRARMVLRCADGVANHTVASELSASRPMVGNWRQRFVADRLGGLADAPRTLTDDQVEAVITKTLEKAFPDATQWSTCSMARTGLFQTAVSRIWRASGVHPRRAESFKLTAAPCSWPKFAMWRAFTSTRPEREVVLRADNRAPVQARSRLPATRHSNRSRGGQRDGSTGLFAALNLQSGRIRGSLSRHPRPQEFWPARYADRRLLDAPRRAMVR